MQRNLTQFMNSRRWTDDSFDPNEKIVCNLYITITDMPSVGRFTATVQVQSSRPVYNTSYSSVLFNYIDKEWTFDYATSQPINFTEAAFTDNLSSLLAFYAYLIIGLDNDSFSEESGTRFYEKANVIANNAAQSSAPGWSAFDKSGRNRYSLCNNLLNNRFSYFRKGLYVYHRLGMDVYSDNADSARGKILEALENFVKTNDQTPGTLIVNAFFDAKASELLNIFLGAEAQLRQKAYNLLIKVDPTKADRYQSLISG